jgi:hypothetical protein
MQTPKCETCGRQLTADESIAAGVGPECAEKQQRFLAACGSSLEEIGSLVLHTDATVRRWAEIAGRAIRKGNRRDAQRFIETARREVEYVRVFGEHKLADLV